MTAWGVSPRAFASAWYPPTASYSSRLVRSRSSASARTIARASIAIAQLLGDRGNVLGLHVRSVAVVDCDDSGPATAAQAFDRAQRDRTVRRGLPGADAELALERLEHLL